jgi:hypothetical protein
MVGHLAAALLLKKTARCFLASMLSGSLLATSSVSRNASVKHSSASAYSPLAKCLLPSSFFLAACFCSSVSFLELLTTVRLTDVLSSSARIGSGASGCNFLLFKSCRNGIVQQVRSEGGFGASKSTRYMHVVVLFRRGADRVDTHCREHGKFFPKRIKHLSHDASLSRKALRCARGRQWSSAVAS